MSGDMGTFRVDVEIENPARPGVRRPVKSVLVDTGAELSWVPAEILEDLGIQRYNRWRFQRVQRAITAQPSQPVRRQDLAYSRVVLRRRKSIRMNCPSVIVLVK
ncbi:MAG TPA: hypothetical protein VI383_10575 [Gemmatimonadales bacterium]|nr:hypothetical protein [Gemmatimonadales bacterium]